MTKLATQTWLWQFGCYWKYQRQNWKEIATVQDYQEWTYSEGPISNLHYTCLAQLADPFGTNSAASNAAHVKKPRPASRMHRSDRDYELGCYYWVQDRVAYRVVRGDRTRSSWISEKEGSLQFGNLDRVGEGFWEPWTPFNHVSDAVVYDPCVGCNTCNDKWRKHPRCWHCKLSGRRISKKLPKLARGFGG